MPEKLEAYQIPVLLEDVRALAEELGAKKFVLAGHDWGGVIAWDFAAAQPEMLHKLVILNAPHPTVLARELLNNPAQQKASAYFNVFNSPTAEPLLSQDDFAILRRAVFAGSWANDDDLRKYLECWRRGLTGGLNYYRAAGLKSPIGGEESEPSQFLTPRNPITVPTLVIWGERDIALLTGNLDGLDQHVKNLKIQRLPEAGHFVVHEQSAVVIRSMRQFLQEA